MSRLVVGVLLILISGTISALSPVMPGFAFGVVIATYLTIFHKSLLRLPVSHIVVYSAYSWFFACGICLVISIILFGNNEIGWLFGIPGAVGAFILAHEVMQSLYIKKSVVGKQIKIIVAVGAVAGMIFGIKFESMLLPIIFYTLWQFSVGSLLAFFIHKNSQYVLTPEEKEEIDSLKKLPRGIVVSMLIVGGVFSGIVLFAIFSGRIDFMGALEPIL